MCGLPCACVGPVHVWALEGWAALCMCGLPCACVGPVHVCIWRAGLPCACVGSGGLGRPVHVSALEGWAALCMCALAQAACPRIEHDLLTNSSTHILLQGVFKLFGKLRDKSGPVTLVKLQLGLVTDHTHIRSRLAELSSMIKVRLPRLHALTITIVKVRCGLHAQLY